MFARGAGLVPSEKWVTFWPRNLIALISRAKLNLPWEDKPASHNSAKTCHLHHQTSLFPLNSNALHQLFAAGCLLFPHCSPDWADSPKPLNFSHPGFLFCGFHVAESRVFTGESNLPGRLVLWHRNCFILFVFRLVIPAIPPLS